MKKMNKKGFTLAELLIVVAIIAVLTAIAVPLFVGALDNAQKAVFQSNRDAVRSAGIVRVMGKDSTYLEQLTATNNTIKVTGTFEKSDKGEWVLKGVKIDNPAAKPAKDDSTDYNTWKNKKEEIIVYLTAADLTTDPV